MSSENAIVPVHAGNGQTSALAVNAAPMNHLIDRLRVVWCNVPLASPEAKKLLSAVVADVTIKDDDRKGHPFAVVACLVQKPSEHVTPEGEVFTAPCVTLLTEEGDTFRWFSSGVADCLAVLSMDRPGGLWSPPIWLKCVGIKTKNGRMRMTLQAAEDPNPAPAGKEKKNGR